MMATAGMTMMASPEITVWIIGGTSATMIEIEIEITTTIGTATGVIISIAAAEACQSAALFSTSSGNTRK